MSFTFQGGNCPLHPLLGPRGPPCFSWARSTLGLRVSLPSAVDVRFLALRVAHREQVRRLNSSASLLALPLSPVWLPSAEAYSKPEGWEPGPGSPQSSALEPTH